MYIKPFILFVPGAWHSPAHYEPIRSLLATKGYDSSAVTLASVGGAPPIGLADDAQRVRDELTKLIEVEQKNVVVVAHSYGGVVATQSVDEKFKRELREKDGKKGWVEHLVYMCAFLPLLGESLVANLREDNPDGTIDENGISFLKNIGYWCYNDLPTEQQDYWAKICRPMSGVAFTDNVTQTAWDFHPVSYLHTNNDHILPIPNQKRMVKAVEDAGTKINVHTLSSDHSPFLSHMDKLVNALECIIEGK